MLNVDTGIVICAHVLVVAMIRWGDILLRIRINNYRLVHIQPILRRDGVCFHNGIINFFCYAVCAEIE